MTTAYRVEQRTIRCSDAMTIWRQFCHDRNSLLRTYDSDASQAVGPRTRHRSRQQSH